MYMPFPGELKGKRPLEMEAELSVDTKVERPYGNGSNCQPIGLTFISSNIVTLQSVLFSKQFTRHR